MPSAPTWRTSPPLPHSSPPHHLPRLPSGAGRPGPGRQDAPRHRTGGTGAPAARRRHRDQSWSPSVRSWPEATDPAFTLLLSADPKRAVSSRAGRGPSHGHSDYRDTLPRPQASSGRVPWRSRLNGHRAELCRDRRAGRLITQIITGCGRATGARGHSTAAHQRVIVIPGHQKSLCQPVARCNAASPRQIRALGSRGIRPAPASVATRAPEVADRHHAMAELSGPSPAPSRRSGDTLARSRITPSDWCWSGLGWKYLRNWAAAWEPAWPPAPRRI